MTEVPRKVLDKARKLLNLKERADTEGEALAATKALAKLVDKHRIEIATIEGLGAPSNEVMAFEEDQPLLVYQRKTTWRFDLASILCDHYGVAFILRNRIHREKKILLAGRKTDIAMVRYMMEWLEPQIQMIAMSSGAKGRDELDSFRIGFVWGIHKQLEEARAEATEGNPSAALVLRCRTKEAMNWLESQDGKRRPELKSDKARKVNMAWFTEGKKKGKDHHLGKSLED